METTVSELSAKSMSLDESLRASNAPSVHVKKNFAVSGTVSSIGSVKVCLPGKAHYRGSEGCAISRR
jgi:hypothetical protein